MGVLWVDGKGIANNVAYWKPRWEWIGEGGASAVMYYLMERNLEGFDPQGIPPMIEVTRGSVEGWIAELVRDPEGTLVLPSGEDIEDRLFNARELCYLYEGKSQLLNEISNTQVKVFSQELARQRVRKCSEYKLNVKGVKGCPYKWTPTRWYVFGSQEEPASGWSDLIRKRKVNKSFYG